MGYLDEQKALDLEHTLRPQPGDYWHDRLAPCFVVLGTACGRVLACNTTRDVDRHHWTWDLKKIELWTPAEMQGHTRYASVVPRRHEWAAKEVAEAV